MRILLASKTMEMGGIERCVVSLARELQARGHQTWVVSSGGHLVGELERHGTPHVVAPLEITSPRGIVASAHTIRQLAEREKIDLIHSFSATASVAINLALRQLARGGQERIHLVSSPMGLQNSPREWAVTTWLRNWVLTLGAERILVISPEIRRHLKLVRARDDFLVDFSFVGLDVDAFQSHPGDYASVRAEFGFPPNARLVSTIGALHPRKSHELFVRAAAQVARSAPDVRFLVVGGGELLEELRRQATEQGLDGRLVLTGVRDDVARILSASDVYVKPGIVEGYVGLTVLEALALAKPVIAFDTEDVKLALADGVTGLVVPNGDTDALAEKVVYLLDHPEVGAALGRAGQQLVLERFHFGRLAERLEQFYERILAVPRAAYA